MADWYVLYTKPHCEQQVENKLLADGIETFYPVMPAVVPRRGRPACRAFFPCYLFARVDLPRVGISRLNWTPGMRHLVMFGGIPARVDDAVVSRIRQHLSQPHVMDDQGEFLNPGDRVLLTSGPFRDIEAVFDKRLSTQGRVRVLIDFLKRSTAVDVDASALRKISSDRQSRTLGWE